MSHALEALNTGLSAGDKRILLRQEGNVVTLCPCSRCLFGSSSVSTLSALSAETSHARLLNAAKATGQAYTCLYNDGQHATTNTADLLIAAVMLPIVPQLLRMSECVDTDHSGSEILQNCGPCGHDKALPARHILKLQNLTAC
jgi:hypothetical protein